MRIVLPVKCTVASLGVWVGDKSVEHLREVVWTRILLCIGQEHATHNSFVGYLLATLRTQPTTLHLNCDDFFGCYHLQLLVKCTAWFVNGANARFMTNQQFGAFNECIELFRELPQITQRERCKKTSQQRDKCGFASPLVSEEPEDQWDSSASFQRRETRHEEVEICFISTQQKINSV